MFDIKFDIRAVEQLGVDLSRLSGAQIGQVSRQALNEVVERTYVFSRKDMNRNINLSDSYVESKMRLDRAESSTNPQASITARGDLTPLDRFNAYVVTRPVNWTNEKILSMGKTFGPWPWWTRRKGDEARGIPVNEKAASVAVTVTRGAPKQLGSRAFRMRLRNGNGYGNGYGTFIRENGKPRHKYGPSPYQLFRQTINENAGRFAEDLERTAGALAMQTISKAIK